MNLTLNSAITDTSLKHMYLLLVFCTISEYTETTINEVTFKIEYYCKENILREPVNILLKLNNNARFITRQIYQLNLIQII